MLAANEPPHMVSRAVSVIAAMARSGSPVCADYAGEDLELHRDRRARLSRAGFAAIAFLDESQRSGLVTETHTGQGEITNELIIFRLFFEKRFQFAARLSPTFLGGGVVAGDFLRPT